MANGWKVTAIIFIILFALQTITFSYLIYVGSKELRNEEICAYDICDYDEVTAYKYEEGVCYCYDRNEELIVRERLD
jgi:hypothetical protein